MSHKVFRDAVHDMISLHRERGGPAADGVDWGDALLLALIDTPELQRLRRIRQLGPAARVYPSAEHSRFSHALGTLHLAKRILATLCHPQPLLDRQRMLQVKVAALFHDVGHGPYSHVFELIAPGMASHEAWGWRILSARRQPRRIIEQHCRRLGLAVDSFFRGLAAILDPAAKGDGQHIGRQVISSQLDADRMDYLLRDAHFTGVSYGRYDLEWLLHSLRGRQMAGETRLCVDISKGPAALESYIHARDHMYRQVYDHKTVRAFEMATVHFFRLLRHLVERTGVPPPGTPPALAALLRAMVADGEPGLDDYLRLDDTVIDYAIGQWAEMVPATALEAELRWKSRSLRDRKPIYRRLRWRGPGMVGGNERIDDPAVAALVSDFFTERAEEPISLPDGEGGHRTLPLKLLARVDRVERAPYAHLQYMSGRADPIHVVDGTGRVLPAERASAQINLLGQSRRRLVQVFVDPRAVDAVKALVAEHFSRPEVGLADD